MEGFAINPIINQTEKSNKLIEKKEKQNLILFTAGKLVSLLGTYIYTFAISLYVLKTTGSGTSFAFSILFGTLPRVLLSPIAGSVADRVDRKKMIVGLDILSGIVVLGLMGLSVVYGLRIPFVYGASFVLSVIATFFGTSFGAAIPKLVTDKSLIKINSYNRAIDSSASIMGPIFGGLIFSMVSINLFLLINGISFILSAISELFIEFDLNCTQNGKQTVSKTINASTIMQDIKEVIIFIRGNKILCTIMPFSMMFNFLIHASLAVVFPYLINSVLNMSAAQYGIIEASFSLGMLAAAIIIGRLPERKNKLKGLIVGIIGMGLTLFVMGIPGVSFFRSANINVIFLLYSLMGLIFAFLLVMIDMPLNVLLQRIIPNEMLGRVMGILGTISGALAPLGILLAGISLSIIPAYLIFFATGIYFVTAALLMAKNKAMQSY